MADFFWFSDAQWSRIEPLLPTNVRGKERVDDKVAQTCIEALPPSAELVGDKGYDSQRLRHWLANYGVSLLIPTSSASTAASNGERLFRTVRQTNSSSTLS